MTCSPPLTRWRCRHSDVADQPSAPRLNFPLGLGGRAREREHCASRPLRSRIVTNLSPFSFGARSACPLGLASSPAVRSPMRRSRRLHPRSLVFFALRNLLLFTDQRKREGGPVRKPSQIKKRGERGRRGERKGTEEAAQRTALALRYAAVSTMHACMLACARLKRSGSKTSVHYALRQDELDRSGKHGLGRYQTPIEGAGQRTGSVWRISLSLCAYLSSLSVRSGIQGVF